MTDDKEYVSTEEFIRMNRQALNNRELNIRNSPVWWEICVLADTSPSDMNPRQVHAILSRTIDGSDEEDVEKSVAFPTSSRFLAPAYISLSLGKVKELRHELDIVLQNADRMLDKELERIPPTEEEFRTDKAKGVIENRLRQVLQDHETGRFDVKLVHDSSGEAVHVYNGRDVVTQPVSLTINPKGNSFELQLVHKGEVVQNATLGFGNRNPSITHNADAEQPVSIPLASSWSARAVIRVPQNAPEFDDLQLLRDLTVTLHKGEFIWGG